MNLVWGRVFINLWEKETGNVINTHNNSPLMGVNGFILYFQGAEGEEVFPMYDALREAGCEVDVYSAVHNPIKGEKIIGPLKFVKGQIAVVDVPPNFGPNELEEILGAKSGEVQKGVDWNFEVIGDNQNNETSSPTRLTGILGLDRKEERHLI